MGELRKIVEEYVRTKDTVDNESPAERVFRQYKSKYQNLIGKAAIWRTFQNKNIKKPQLVTIEGVYDHFVLVRKDCYSIDGKLRNIRYGINYSSLISRHDTLDVVE